MIKDFGLLTPLLDYNNSNYASGEYADKGCSVASRYAGKQVKCKDCPLPDCYEMDKYTQTFRCRVMKASRYHYIWQRKEEIDRLYRVFNKIPLEQCLGNKL